MFRRREFPKSVRREAFARSGGVCECHLVPGLGRPEGCGARLRHGGIFYEHIHPDGAGGSPTLDNCAVLSKTCWREKTDRIDRPMVAKAARQLDRAIGIPRSTAEPMPGARNSPWKRKLGRLGRDAWERRAG